MDIIISAIYLEKIMTQAVKDETFEEEVLKSDIPVLVDFWAEWCGPCRMLGPIIDQISSEYAGKIKVMKMNVDENPKIPSGFGIRGIPTMMLFKNGELVDTKVGVLQKDALSAWLDQSV